MRFGCLIPSISSQTSTVNINQSVSVQGDYKSSYISGIFHHCMGFRQNVIFLLFNLHNKSLIFYRHIITDCTPLLHGYINRLTNLQAICLRLSLIHNWPWDFGVFAKPGSRAWSLCDCKCNIRLTSRIHIIIYAYHHLYQGHSIIVFNFNVRVWTFTYRDIYLVHYLSFFYIDL